jgi:phospholipase/carboxylesterase
MSETLPLVHLHRPALKPIKSRAPLLVLAHGYGSNEQDLFGLHSYLDERFIVVSARAPLTLGQGAYAWYTLDWRPDGTINTSEAEAPASLNRLTQFVEAAREVYDAGPVFLAGFSQGAMMSEALALARPDLIAGAVLMSGRTINLLRADPPQGKLWPPFVVTHGAQDQVVAVAEGRATRDFLTQLGAAVDYHEYPMPHTISESCLADVDAWLRTRIDAETAA